MNINLVYPSRYVKASDLGDKLVTVTIKSFVMEELGHGAEKERKPVIYFERATKGLILNRTNAMIIASMYTPETDNWIGNPIILYSLRVKAFGAWHEAVRVKEQIPPRNVGAAQMPEAMTEAPPIDDEDDLLDVDEGQAPRDVDAATSEITSGPVAIGSDADADADADIDGDGPTDDELEVLGTWRTPQDAKVWAVAAGACTNMHHAGVSWIKVVKDNDGFNSGNAGAVYLSFLRRQNEKLAEVQPVVTAQTRQPVAA